VVPHRNDVFNVGARPMEFSVPFIIVEFCVIDVALPVVTDGGVSVVMKLFSWP
jgi:hypothetical protein